MKKLFIILLLIPILAKAQYPAPTSVTNFISSSLFFKIVGTDTTVYVKNSSGLWFPLGRTHPFTVTAPLTYSGNVLGINATIAGFPLTSTVTFAPHTPGYGLVGSNYSSAVSQTWTADTASAGGLVSKSRLATNLGAYQKFISVPNGKNIVNFTIDGVNARVVTSNNYSITGNPQQFAIFFHYYGGDYTIEPSSKLRDSLLNNGYSIATLGDGDNWGNEYSQQLYVKLYNYVIKNFNVTRTPIAVSESMGGLPALNIMRRALIPFKAYLPIISVVNLGSYYNKLLPGSAAALSIQAAYKFSTPADSTKVFFGYDPYKYLNKSFGDTTYRINTPAYFINGSLDTSARQNYSRDIWRGLVRQRTNSLMEVEAGIGHDTTIITPAIAHRLIRWLRADSTFTRILPDTTLLLKTNNNIALTASQSGNNALNYLRFFAKGGVNTTAIFGHTNGTIVGTNEQTWSNFIGPIGIFSELGTSQYRGIVNPTTGLVTIYETLSPSGNISWTGNISSVGTGSFGAVTAASNDNNLTLNNPSGRFSTINFSNNSVIKAAMSYDNSNNLLQFSLASGGVPITISPNTVSVVHLSGLSPAPTIAAGPGSGTSPTVSISGNDKDGVITITTGTSPTASAIMATATFNSAYASAPYVIIAPGNQNAATVMSNSSFVICPAVGQTNGPTTTTFAIVDSGVAVGASTTYVFTYHVN